MVYRRGYRAFTTHQLIVTKKKREIDKIGYTRVVSEQNRVPFFFATGRAYGRMQNAFKKRSGA